MATEQIKVENQEYLVKGLMYPEDLDTNPAFDHHKIMFFINVAVDGVLSGFTSKNGQPTQYTLSDIPQNDMARQSAIRQAGQYASGFVKSGARQKRLSGAIALHLPTELSQNTSVTWSEEDMNTPTAIAAEVIRSAISPTPQTDSHPVTNGISSLGRMVSTGASVAGRAALKSNTTAQFAGRITPGNSKEEQLFKAVNFRTFAYSFTFAPKSKSEADNVMNIIRMFKHHMLPEFADAARFLYIYPSEFNIKYFVGYKENTFIEKQLTAVLTRVGINYTPNGQYNAFDGGMSQQINLSLEFTELALLSKESSPYNSHGA